MYYGGEPCKQCGGWMTHELRGMMLEPSLQGDGSALGEERGGFQDRRQPRIKEYNGCSDGNCL